jgi:hypothetical protein
MLIDKLSTGYLKTLPYLVQTSGGRVFEKKLELKLGMEILQSS